MSTGDPLNQNNAQQAGTPAPSNQAAEEQAALDRLFLIVAKDIADGKAKDFTVKKLTDMGMPPLEASTYYDNAKVEVDKIKDQEKMASSAIIPALIGSLVAAIIGGLVWGWLAVATNKVYGIVALGIGFICAYGAVLLSGNKKGLPLQIIACVTSVIGIVIGKYYIFTNEYIKLLAQKFGPEYTAGMNWFSGTVATGFFTTIQYSFEGYDILWLILALSMAWSIPQSSLKQIKVK